ncbi:hypothetical protein [Streptomyces sp. NPDC005407]|uniref:hypothetical protein n=1 Tax=Streptomyces sp. NPDC005407 TaxID=3155340 RepID=UPI0033A0E4DD
MPDENSEPRMTSPGLPGNETHFDYTIADIQGVRAMVVQGVIPDDAPPRVKNGLALRRAANTTGVCPECNARLAVPNRAERRKAVRAGRMLWAQMLHEEWCGVYADSDGRWGA